MIKLGGIKTGVLALVVGKILQVSIALISVRLMTSYLSEVEVGKYYLVLAVMTLLNFGLLNAPGQYFNRKVIDYSLNGVLVSASLILLFYRLLLILLGLAVTGVAYYALSLSQNFEIEPFYLVIALALLGGTTLVISNSINILGHRLAFVIINTAYLSLGLLFSVVLISFYQKSALAWYAGLAIGQLLLLIPSLYIVFSLDKSRVGLQIYNGDEFKRIVLFCAPLVVTLLLQWANNSGYRFVINDIYSVEVLAKVSVAIAVAAAIFGAIESLVNQYYLPLFYKDITHANKEERVAIFEDYFSRIIKIYLCILMFIFVFSKSILVILVDPKFHGVWLLLSIAVIIEFSRAATNVLYWISQSELRTGGTAWPYAGGLSLWLIILYSVDFTGYEWGIPLTIGVGGAVTFSLMFISMRKLLPVGMSISKRYVASLLVVATFYFAISFLFSSTSLLFSIALVGLCGLPLLYFIYCIDQNKM
ncbi:oligosaccharide flippase family protein [Thalassolituus sp. UBA2590]|uniref:oligosaccharide flippase family protein n=1 Tax=Thalassolituus sp. UBA2590 TaxID=1947663 RepID=UPI00264719AD|nr:oligosaccharide flippase family protein [Thalassolituus sp. UBA2590]